MAASLPTQMYAVAEPRAGQTDSAALAQGMADAVDAAAATCPLPAEPCTNFPEFTAYNMVRHARRPCLARACSYERASLAEPDSRGP